MDGAFFDGDSKPVDAAHRHELRQQMAGRRRALPPPARMAAAQGLRRSLEQLPEYLTDLRVAGYWASGGELPLNLVIPPLAARGQRFLLPILAKGRQLHFAPNRYGIPEPVAPREWFAPFQLDLVLVPLLAFDRRGHRLGHGGGYYDRSFAFLKDQGRPTEPLLVGVAYAFQEVEDLKAEAWDVPLDYVATDHELIACSPTGQDGAAHA